jgi:hypothetical protein
VSNLADSDSVLNAGFSPNDLIRSDFPPGHDPSSVSNLADSDSVPNAGFSRSDLIRSDSESTSDFPVESHFVIPPVHQSLSDSSENDDFFSISESPQIIDPSLKNHFLTRERSLRPPPPDLNSFELLVPQDVAHSTEFQNRMREFLNEVPQDALKSFERWFQKVAEEFGIVEQKAAALEKSLSCYSEIVIRLNPLNALEELIARRSVEEFNEFLVGHDPAIVLENENIGQPMVLMLLELLCGSSEIEAARLNWVIAALSKINFKDVEVRKAARPIVQTVAQMFGGNQSKKARTIVYITRSLLEE